MKVSRLLLTVIIFGIMLVTGSYAQQSKTFTNPLLPGGADPWCIYEGGYYYYTNTTDKNITLWKTNNIAGLKTAEKQIVLDTEFTIRN